MSNLRGYEGWIGEILAWNFSTGRNLVTKEIEGNKKSLHLNYLADPGYSFKFYVEIKIRTKEKVFTVYQNEDN